jgi:hypothetical protein
MTVMLPTVVIGSWVSVLDGEDGGEAKCERYSSRGFVCLGFGKGDIYKNSSMKMNISLIFSMHMRMLPGE